MMLKVQDILFTRDLAYYTTRRVQYGGKLGSLITPSI
jgi:hypothetical protein